MPQQRPNRPPRRPKGLRKLTSSPAPELMALLLVGVVAVWVHGGESASEPSDSGPDTNESSGSVSDPKPPSMPAWNRTGAGGDFHNDGREQLTLSANDDMPVLLGRDQGKVTTRPIDVDLPGKDQGRSLSGAQAIGDVDGDGYDDLVICDDARESDDPGSLLVLFGADDGWSDVVELKSPIEDHCSGLAAGDGDGDGRDDLFVAGGFELGRATAGKNARSPEAWNFEVIERAGTRTAAAIFDDIVVGDVDGDGRADLINERGEDLEEVVGSAVQVRLAADGFETPKRKRVDCGLECRFRVGDLEGDGRDDLVLFDDVDEGARIWSGTAEGIDVRREPTARVGSRSIGIGNLPGYATLSLSGGGLADIEGDGTDDLVFGLTDRETERYPARVLVVPGGEKGPRSRQAYELAVDAAVHEDEVSRDEPGPPIDLNRADLDGDGADTVVLTVRHASGQRTDPDAARTYALEAEDRADLDLRRPRTDPVPADRGAAAWDVDGDGARDLVLVASGPAAVEGRRPEPLAVLFNDPDGVGFRDVRTIDPRPGQHDSSDPGTNDMDGTANTSGDFDADGYADVAICLDESPTILFGSPQGPKDRVRLERLECARLRAADLDQDGYADLVLDGAGVDWAAGGPDVRRPDGWFVQRIGENGGSAALGDVNGDGWTDVVVSRDDGPGVRSYLGGKDGFRSGVAHDGGGRTGELAVGDLNGDGFDDLALGSEVGAEKIRIWYASEHGLELDRKPRVVSGSDVGLAPEASFGEALAIGDADGDDHVELAVGAPAATVDGAESAGVVAVLPGGPEGPSVSDARLIDQNDVPGAPQDFDLFGSDLAYRDVAAGPEGPELVVVSRNEDDGAGRVHVLGDERTWRITPEDAGMRSVERLELGLGGTP